MSHVVISPQAESELLDIWLYIAKDRLLTADRFLDKLHDRIVSIAEAPLAGRPRPELRPDLRSVPVNNILILYRPIADGIEVVRVLVTVHALTR